MKFLINNLHFTNLSWRVTELKIIISFFLIDYIMSTLRYELIGTIINRAFTLLDTNIYNDIHKQFEFQKQTTLADKILTNDEKTYAIRWLTKNYDQDKVIFNDGT